MQDNQNNKTFDTSYLLESLTLLKNGLIKNGEDNIFTDKMTEWINNIDSIDTIKDIAKNMQFKTNPRGDYYDTTPMFNYLSTFWSYGEHNKKDLTAFYPRKDERAELQKVFIEIKEKAAQCLSLLNQDQAKLDSEQKSLSYNIRKLYDTMLRIYTFDPQKAANVCRLSLHTAEENGLKEIIEYFDESKNKQMLEYILDFSKHFIIQNQWCNLHVPIEGICQNAARIVNSFEKDIQD